ncbi:hypothetical protein RUM43_001428 [Polyplax serrata]|uniref:Large ribosomal subunit protein mL43 n=1 Tax=Polyplax serrata TaxID=468196 RepID=A0AAN8SEC4_POLSC
MKCDDHYEVSDVSKNSSYLSWLKIRKMSNAHLYLTPIIPKAILGNGLGRYVCQLQRVTIKFCKSNGGSRGVREFIENGLVDFAKENPNVVIYMKPRRHRTPVFVAEYLNGRRKWMSVNNFTKEEVIRWLNLLKTQSGQIQGRLSQQQNTQNPSIQGPWTPFMFRNPEFNVSTFPQEKYSLPKNLAPSATEILIEMFKNQKLEGENDELKKGEINM